jgi:ERCC4-type nuclease
MFHNIFKKTIKKTKNLLPKIIIDIHEKNSLILSELATSKEIELEIQSLKIGDYLIGNLAIERKTINDLISSIISKRILNQIENLKNYEKKLLIIEGNIKDLNQNLNINPNIIKGFILSCIINHNLPVIETKDYKETSKILLILAKQLLKNSTPTFHSRIPKTIEEQKQYILEAFPNIGPKTAKKLLEKFQTLNKVFNANEEDLNEILKSNSRCFKDLIKN